MDVLRVGHKRNGESEFTAVWGEKTINGGEAEGEKRPAGVISLCMVPFLSFFVLFFFNIA